MRRELYSFRKQLSSSLCHSPVSQIVTDSHQVLFHRLGLVLFLLCLIIGPAIAQPAPEPVEQLEQKPKVIAAADGGQVSFQANASMPLEDTKMYTLPELPYAHDVSKQS